MQDIIERRRGNVTSNYEDGGGRRDAMQQLGGGVRKEDELLDRTHARHLHVSVSMTANNGPVTRKKVPYGLGTLGNPPL